MKKNMIRSSTSNVDIELIRQAETIGMQVGNTPVRLFRYWKNENIVVHAKLEWEQISGSVKARAAYAIIYNAILEGKLNSTTLLLDATSGKVLRTVVVADEATVTKD